MSRCRVWFRLFSGLLMAALLLGPVSPAGAVTRAGRNGSHAAAQGPQPELGFSVRNDTSPALRDIPPIPPAGQGPLAAGGIAAPLGRLPRLLSANDGAADPVVQDSFVADNMPAPLQNFEGINNRNGVHPPDTQGDVGPNHYVQWVNLSFQIWDKQGHSLLGPADGNTIWSGFGGMCETHNDGDPVTLYDPLADRWLMSQFALATDGYYECIAISQTPDPTLAWYRYAFRVSATVMNDYPKFGVWPDAYYMTANQFLGGASWNGAGVYAFDRAKMLQGQPASYVYFDLYSANINFGAILPADLDGEVTPAAGAPGVFAEVDKAMSGAPDAIRLWNFHVDWATPANSTFGVANQPTQILPVQTFQNMCPSTSDCIPQPGTTVKLDAIGGQLMHRLQYRNFGDHESLVANHTVDTGGGHAGLRWYELRRSGGGAWSIYQQGTYAPDADQRWMASAAMDHMGNIAIGYSVSSSSTYPSIRYAGRLAGDPLGQLSQGENELIAGSGAQTSTYHRWGDYSMLAIDPADDCTFWFTTEYLTTTGYAPWRTRIGAFKFPNCASVLGTLSGQVTNAVTGLPIPNATVQAVSGLGAPQNTTAGTDGRYAMLLPPDSYTVNFSAFGYLPASRAGVSVAGNAATTLSVTLDRAPDVPISGHVTDANTGWPVYANLAFDGVPGAPTWNIPVTGYYTTSLPAGLAYTVHVSAWTPGYLPASRVLPALVSPQTQDFALSPDLIACTAPGYHLAGSACVAQAGGLVVGTVTDANTSGPLAGATITAELGQNTTAQFTADPGLAGAPYVLFLPAGSHSVTAAMPGGYANFGWPVIVPTGSAVRRDFALGAGRLETQPGSLAATVNLGSAVNQPLLLNNTGGLAASFSLDGLPRAAAALGPIERPVFALKPFRSMFRSPTGLMLYPAPDAPALAAGVVQSSWPAGTAASYGIAYDPAGNSLWVASPTTAWGGNGMFTEFSTAGMPTGRSHPLTWHPPYGPAGLAMNWNTGKLWAMNVGDEHDNCIYEVDPAGGPTGHKICPGSATGFEFSQRGLAYDPASDTWFAGSWNDFMIYHFDHTGRILDAVSTGLAVSGLAYNPKTQHLFAMTNNDPDAVYVLDTAAGYALVGKFAVSAGFGAYAGAGLQIDCAGALWAVDQNTNVVYRFTSGETTNVCAPQTVPWLSFNPATGSVPANNSQSIDVVLSAESPAITQPGTYQGQIVINHDTPYVLPNIPVTMTVVAPATWGQVKGTVIGLGPCDAAGTGLANAQVVVTGSGGGSWTLTTDATGTYALWLDQANSPLTIHVTASGYSDQTANGVVVTAPATTMQDLSLRLNAPCLAVQPSSLAQSVVSGRQITAPLTLINSGAGVAIFDLDDVAGAVDAAWLRELPVSGSVPAGGALVASVTFDAGAIGVAGNYLASLRVGSNDTVHPLQSLPVTMTVLAFPTYMPIVYLGSAP